jgi:curved DNA-binding protein CbpA
MSTNMGDYYDLLGIPSTASKKEIRSAFQKKAKLIHPDMYMQYP